jgi:hypothetical protein
VRRQYHGARRFLVFAAGDRDCFQESESAVTKQLTIKGSLRQMNFVALPPDGRLLSQGWRSELLLKMLDRWNAHDIEGHMEVYATSPDLLVIVDSEQFNGWQQLHDS